jgi:alkanesulfonate monooxygenase
MTFEFTGYASAHEAKVRPDDRVPIYRGGVAADTEQEAWDRAGDILELTTEKFGELKEALNLDHSNQHDSQRLSLLGYVALGVGTLLIRRFSPLADARDSRTLIGLVREQSDRVPGPA